MEKDRRVVRKILQIVLGFYRYGINPILGSPCRFFPSCSQYAETAIVRFGFLKGGLLAIKRILRCNPWCEGGLDSVPDK